MAVVVSALIFGITHGNLVQGIYAFLIGVVFCMVYEYSGRITVVIFSHMAANLFSIFRSVSLSFQTLENQTVFYWGTTLAAVVVTGGLLYVVGNRRRR
jgi:hypothetical protein